MIRKLKRYVLPVLTLLSAYLMNAGVFAAELIPETSDTLDPKLYIVLCALLLVLIIVLVIFYIIKNNKQK